MISAYLFVKNFIFFFLTLIISISCFLKDSQNVFVQSLPLHTSFLFSVVLNENIIDFKEPDGICSPDN